MEEAKSKRAEIMQVATELLLNNSYANVNMSKIAKACGITKAGIYYHFKNKVELITECMHTTLQDLNVIINSHCSENIDVREKLYKISADIYKVGHSNPGMLTLFLRSITEPEMRSILSSMHDEVDRFVREIGEIMKLGIEAGEVRDSIDPLLASRMLLGTFLMQLQHFTLVNSDEVFNPSDAVDILFNGITSL